MFKYKTAVASTAVAIALAATPLSSVEAHYYHHGGPVFGLAGAIVGTAAALVAAPFVIAAAPFRAPVYYAPPPVYNAPPPRYYAPGPAYYYVRGYPPGYYVPR